MGSLRCIDIQSCPTEVLELTSLTFEEFQHVVLPFKATFQARMTQWRLDGRPYPTRRYTTCQNCPLPTPEDRLLFIPVYLKTSPLQVVQGRLCGMGQSKAPSVASCPLGGAAVDAVHAEGYSHPVRARAGAAPWSGRSRSDGDGCTDP